ncbi:AMP binding protein [Mycena belliarum]|uniref:AMP binding protein n=1 Tax=Mycena belliarum TaxID=1033014 RepID=A0AAD6XSC6_9AGAR|nr:AMP binding protein [Mycena belliae]
MAPRVYTSALPEVPILTTSIFTRLFASHGPGDVGGSPGSLTAFIDAASGTSITRTQLKHLALSFAYGLRDHPTTRASAKRGDTMLIYSPNSLAWPVVLHGGIAGGLRCTLANSAYNARELAYQYTDSTAKLVLTAEEGIPVVRAMFADLGFSKAEGDRHIVVLGKDLQWAGGPAAAPAPEATGLVTLADLLMRGALDREEMFEGEDAHETVLLCYSSGTTGKPKGVETTHQNLTTIVDMNITTFPHLKEGEQPIIATLPFYHMYGTVNIVTLAVALASPAVIMSRFDPEQFCANIARYKVAFAFVVPPILVVLARHPAVDSYDLSSLEYLFSGAAPLGAELVRMVQKRLLSKRKPGARCLITQSFGMTEMSPGTHTLPFSVADRKVGSVGELLPNLEARLVEDDEGKVDAEEGEPGELWLRGKTVMKGYLNNAAATKNAITPDGWFRSGDVAIRDKEGHYFIVDRRKELIKYKGFQVPPAELEALLLTHPDVADAAVIGIESIAEATELPRAYVVHAHPDHVWTPESKAAFERGLVQWVASKVASHKRLRGGVKVIDVVPKSASGKILRRELRDRAKEEVARGEVDVGMKLEAKL